MLGERHVTNQFTCDCGYTRGQCGDRRGRRWEQEWRWELEVQEAPLPKGLLSWKLQEEQEVKSEQPAQLEGSPQEARGIEGTVAKRQFTKGCAGLRDETENQF